MKKRIKGFLIGIITAAFLFGSPVLADNIIKKIQVRFNSINLEINGESVNADNILYNGTTYVPIRKVGELLNQNVEYVSSTKTAKISDKSGMANVKLDLTRQASKRVIMNVEEIAKEVDSTVLINIYDRNNQLVSSGSGVFINENGYIITNYHVIDLGYNIEVVTNETKTGKIYESVEIINYDIKNDLALLKIDANTKGIYINTTNPNLGSKTVAIGSPLGLSNTVSEGIVSGHRTIDEVKYIQTSAPVSPGSSGGALLNTYGELIGIVTAGYIDGENLNLAISSDVVKDFLDKTSPTQKRINTIVNPNYKYIGEMNEKRIEGFGTMFYGNGDIYTGYFENGLRSGNGILYYNNDDELYFGQFVNDKKEGQGFYFYNNGEFYFGDFTDNSATGIGCYYVIASNIYMGELKNGEFDGYGMYQYYEGDLLFGNFIENLLMGHYVYIDEEGKSFIYEMVKGNKRLIK